MGQFQVLRLNEIEMLTNEKSFNEAIVKSKMEKRQLKDLQEKRESIYSSVCNIAADQAALAIR